MEESSDLYVGREQTQIKHFILRNYLERFAHIIGSRWNSITYVDEFSGPWNAISDDYRDSSFSIAIEELRRAKSTWQELGREIQLRCVFVEKDARAFQRLESYVKSLDDINVRTFNESFEDSIESIMRFVDEQGRDTFPFFFIDPKGWTGFSMTAISPLLRHRPGEVLINLMTGHLVRFFEAEATRESMIDLFGSPDFDEDIKGLSGNDRLDAIIDRYSKNVKDFGKFDYVCPAIILRPDKERVHYHLLYCTRDAKGVEEFKKVERKAMKEMETARAKAEQRRQAEQGQALMFDAADMPESRYYRELRERYLNVSRSAVVDLLSSEPRVLYDRFWDEITRFPMVWESDLRTWLANWETEGRVNVELMPRQRLPARKKGNYVSWADSATSE